MLYSSDCLTLTLKTSLMGDSLTSVAQQTYMYMKYVQAGNSLSIKKAQIK